jgi:hypothetical protein
MHKDKQETIYGLFVIIFVILFTIFVPKKASDIQECGNWFVTATALSLIFIGANIYRKAVIDRLVLIITMCWAIGAAVYLVNIPAINRYYNDYTSLTFFISLLTIGVTTTFFSRAGFIGELGADMNKVRNGSLKMLLLAFVLTVISFLAFYLGWEIFYYFTLPVFIFVNFYVLYERVVVDKW